MRTDRHVLIFFLDGVGMGAADPEANPFAQAELRHLDGLFGRGWHLSPAAGGPGRIETARASLVATDANLEVAGRPQSATGQATILTGRNAPRLLGQHYGPKPNPALAEIIRQGTLFHEVVAAGGRAALIAPYPQRYFDAIESGRRLLSTVPLAATDAGLALMTADDLRAGRAVSPGFAGREWLDVLGYRDIPVLSLAEAGRQIAAIAGRHHFSFFEHWPSDRVGHKGSLEDAAGHLEAIDQALGGLFEAWDDDHGLLILTSDHGNIEEKDHRQHSRNPVPTILLGQGHAELAGRIHDLTDIAAAVRAHLDLPDPALATTAAAG
ncbi:MAG: hypothetical protein ACRDHL_07150 [Candidatus Promineifilaceae bacterium]